MLAVSVAQSCAYQCIHIEMQMLLSYRLDINISLRGASVEPVSTCACSAECELFSLRSAFFKLVVAAFDSFSLEHLYQMQDSWLGQHFKTVLTSEPV